MSTSDESSGGWYSDERRHAFFGNMRVHVGASVIYLMLAYAPLCLWAVDRQVPDWVTSPWGFLWAAFVALAFPSWLWLETMAFEKWVKVKPEPLQGQQRAYFKTMADLAKGFWTAVPALYAIAGLWGDKLR